MAINKRGVETFTAKDEELTRFQRMVEVAIRRLAEDVDSAIAAIPPAPAAIGPSTVAVYVNAAAQALAWNALVRVRFDTAETASAAVATGAAWLFTAPATSYYTIAGAVTVEFADPPPVNGCFVALYLNKNATVVREINHSEGRAQGGFGVGTGNSSIPFAFGIKLSAGDTISLDVKNKDPNAVAIGIQSNPLYTYISITGG